MANPNGLVIKVGWMLLLIGSALWFLGCAVNQYSLRFANADPGLLRIGGEGITYGCMTTALALAWIAVCQLFAEPRQQQPMRDQDE